MLINNRHNIVILNTRPIIDGGRNKCHQSIKGHDYSSTPNKFGNKIILYLYFILLIRNFNIIAPECCYMLTIKFTVQKLQAVQAVTNIVIIVGVTNYNNLIGVDIIVYL